MHPKQPESTLRISRLIQRTVLGVTFLVTPLVSACSDPFASLPWDDAPMDIVLYSASRPEYVGRISAFDLGSGTPRGVAIEAESGAGSWDVVLLDNNGSLALESAVQFEGFKSRARIAEITGVAFEDVKRAPADTTEYTAGPLDLRMDAVYIVRSRLTSCGLLTGSIYAKLKPTEIDAANGIFRFSYVENPNCDDRLLIAPED
jgi:hypothetical protein